MVEREDVDGEIAAVKAYKAAREDTDQADEVAEADEVSSALMEKVKRFKIVLKEYHRPMRFVSELTLQAYFLRLMV